MTTLNLSQQIRRKFLDYFKNQKHRVVPSSPVIPHDDPTLLFINAGMNQFKDVILGKSIRDYNRATSSQKCIRVGGKHNDLENVGHTSRHLTFFEMLGNFSFGDYFKKEAIDFAWEVTLNVYGFDPKFLFATVFHKDNEAFELWTKYLPEERIIRFGEKDNFWAMGDTGPCGPCSELFYDRGSRYGAARNPGEDIEGTRFLEFWNLVFMEFNRDSSGNLHPLPKKCVDTGSGLERVVSLKLGVDSVFETDILRALIGEMEQISNIKYDPKDKEKAPAFHVIADHIRSLSFAIADGVQPSNIDRGYVLRKVLRRAVRYGRQLGMEKPFLGKLVPTLIEKMGADFFELQTSQERITEILLLEEENFLRTLKRGGNILNQVIVQSQASGQISGDDAFKLKDTYGLPLEEILLLAKDDALSVDVRRFEELEHEARLRSRGARKTTEVQVEESIYEGLVAKQGPSSFVGYQQLSCEAVVLSILKDNQEVAALHPGEEGAIFLDRTPFYAEKGGQIGDQGWIIGKNGRFEVLDCQTPFPDVSLHIGLLKEGEIHVGDQITASVDIKRRHKIENNHTATHLLHWALREILGPHVRQGGSIVEPGRLRFDFSHHKALTPEEIRKIEALVNEKIRDNSPIHIYELPYEDAQKRSDIIQFFGEKYGATVRVVDIDYSKELCGGTHTKAPGNIGYFRIFKESSIAAGIRRIEAVTGEEAESFALESDSLLNQLAESLKSQPAQLKEKVERLQQENRTLMEQIEQQTKKMIDGEVESLLSQIKKTHSIPYLFATIPFDGKQLRECADLLMQKSPSLALLLIAKEKDKCSFFACISSDLVGKGIRANELVQVISPFVNGKGGGKADSAQGGGTNPEQIPQALAKAEEWIITKI